MRCQMQNLISVGQGFSVCGYPKYACFPLKAKSSLILLTLLRFTVIVLLRCYTMNTGVVFQISIADLSTNWNQAAPPGGISIIKIGQPHFPFSVLQTYVVSLIDS